MFAQIIGDGGPWFLDEISRGEAHSYVFNYCIFIKNVFVFFANLPRGLCNTPPPPLCIYGCECAATAKSLSDRLVTQFRISNAFGGILALLSSFCFSVYYYHYKANREMCIQTEIINCHN
jgi:hypothetical protein